ncbi:unnamed protein product [Notodromas monacha]|uniref:Uncharacterized protein n=1 Tax=Notodromas monacha TaxID=399045 RepID=A0A7R9BII0_9CRUS|nr:unnamed protein product [Notodromas monacha]CAG0914734.1 unnamed protein product [Notodromas monacha]
MILVFFLLSISSRLVLKGKGGFKSSVARRRRTWRKGASEPIPGCGVGDGESGVALISDSTTPPAPTSGSTNSGPAMTASDPGPTWFPWRRTSTTDVIHATFLAATGGGGGGPLARFPLVSLLLVLLVSSVIPPLAELELNRPVQCSRVQYEECDSTRHSPSSSVVVVVVVVVSAALCQEGFGCSVVDKIKAEKPLECVVAAFFLLSVPPPEVGKERKKDRPRDTQTDAFSRVTHS